MKKNENNNNNNNTSINIVSHYNAVIAFKMMTNRWYCFVDVGEHIAHVCVFYVLTPSSFMLLNTYFKN